MLSTGFGVLVESKNGQRAILKHGCSRSHTEAYTRIHVKDLTDRLGFVAQTLTFMAVTAYMAALFGRSSFFYVLHPLFSSFTWA